MVMVNLAFPIPLCWHCVSNLKAKALNKWSKTSSACDSGYDLETEFLCQRSGWHVGGLCGLWTRGGSVPSDPGLQQWRLVQSLVPALLLQAWMLWRSMLAVGREKNPMRATDDNALHAVLVPTVWRCGVMFLEMVDIGRDRRAASFWPLVQ